MTVLSVVRHFQLTNRHSSAIDWFAWALLFFDNFYLLLPSAYVSATVCCTLGEVYSDRGDGGSSGRQRRGLLVSLFVKAFGVL